MGLGFSLAQPATSAPAATNPPNTPSMRLPTSTLPFPYPMLPPFDRSIHPSVHNLKTHYGIVLCDAQHENASASHTLTASGKGVILREKNRHFLKGIRCRYMTV